MKEHVKQTRRGVMPAYGKKTPQNFAVPESLKKMAKSVLKIQWLESAGHKELFQTAQLRHCGALGTISALQAVNHRPIDTHPPSSKVQPQQHPSHPGLCIHFQLPSAGQNELSCKHPLGSPRGPTRIAPFEGDTNTPGHRTLHHHPVFYRLSPASVQWGQMLPGISPPTHTLK